MSTWAMGDTLEDLGRAPEAEVNLVVSSVGLWAAKVLQERFGIPYVIGTPIRGFMKSLLNAIEGKKAGSISRKGKAHQPDRKQIGKKVQKTRLY